MMNTSNRLQRSPGIALAAMAKIAVYALLTAWALAILFPIYWMFLTSLKPGSMVLDVPPQLIPLKVTLQNFKEIFDTAPVARWFLNSVIVTVAVTSGALISDSMAGYTYSLIKPTGYRIFFFMILGCMMIPDQIRIVPLFIMLKDLNWYNTYAGLIVPFMGSAIGMFLMRQYMSTLPIELMEAAKVEGCNEFKIFTRIVLPLSKPVIAVVAITSFVGNWNGFLWPLILTSSTDMRTLPVGIASLQVQFVTNYGIMMAGAAIAAIPVILIFFMFQKYFAKGITLGAVKE
ncbi:carbohydrate ABC transporter permease [Paenibacillus sp. J2TS4]|uniref:carbohydrate ABC transporter permease n=1 Tax=Paenibacillus sp. J2TS4 TaxID=2807194 RepID=UPI001B1DD05D|nr:carbohydrate ABC transporter permease [Paenibacillus sp. J2TS4]GIP34973.1 sugar ABC transporter permease [Paenibacillus sp. J2TS4]